MASGSRKGSPSPPLAPGQRSSFSDRADPSDIPAEPHGRSGHHNNTSSAEQHLSRQRQTRQSAGPEPNGIPGAADTEGSIPAEEVDIPTSSVEKDAAHFKMVAARFRALMERRERRLEEAMSDPQTRTDLEAMFPGIKEGDYQTLLAGVRGMEEDDFQALLTAARKRRREVGGVGCLDLFDLSGSCVVLAGGVRRAVKMIALPPPAQVLLLLLLLLSNIPASKSLN